MSRIGPRSYFRDPQLQAEFENLYGLLQGGRVGIDRLDMDEIERELRRRLGLRDDILGVVFGPAIPVTISGGSITIGSAGYYQVSGEGGSDDELAHIHGGEHGQAIFLRIDNDIITIVHNQGNIRCGTPKLLATTHDHALLILNGLTWELVLHAQIP